MRDPKKQAGAFALSSVVHAALILVGAYLILPADTPDTQVELSFSQTSLEEVLEIQVLPIEIDKVDVDTDFTESAAGSANFEIEEPSLSFGSVVQNQGGLGSPIRSKSGAASSGVSGQHGKFFGMGARGDRFVFLIDHTNLGGPSPFEFKKHLSAQGKAVTYKAYKELLRTWYKQNKPKDFPIKTIFQVAVEEVARSLGRLDENQRFSILFVGRQIFAQDEIDPVYRLATKQNVRDSIRWMKTIVSYRQTRTSEDPRPAIEAVCRLKPDAIFLLSSGHFGMRPLANGQRVPHQQANRWFFSHLLDQQHAWPCPIHVVGVAHDQFTSRRSVYSDEAQDRLRRIANETSGSCVWVGKF